MKQLHFDSVSAFYPYYLTQHRAFSCRMLHFIGTGLVIAILLITLLTGKWWLFALMPVAGYGFAWTGHFFFERNKPAAFHNPLYSLACDFIMFWHILSGQISQKIAQAEKLYPDAFISEDSASS
ncbi:MAG: membrane protein [Chitinophagales bacterium]|nr:MAG: membrane protein [Chitinophagales bacterium]